MQKIYLDNNATTALDPRVLQAVHTELSALPSNPSSSHSFGQEARKRLSKARETIAAFFQCKPQELIFTSGATEALNMVLRGVKASHILSSDIEHSAVYNTLKDLEKKGTSVTFLSTGSKGWTDPEEVLAHIQPNTGLLVFSAANSETGVKNDLEALSAIALSSGIPLVVDGVALLGKELFEIPAGVSAMVFSGHKLHAPQGTGLAFIRAGFRFSPLLTGGDQEYSKRAGTENLPGIIGLAKAIELLQEELPSATERMRQLRDSFEEQLKAQFPNIVINGEGRRLPNTSNISFTGVDGETLLIQLDRAGLAASHGSACSSGALEPSRVLTQMGLSKERSRSAIRFSLSLFTTQREINQAVTTISSLINHFNRICNSN